MVHIKPQQKFTRNELSLFYSSRASEFYEKFDKWSDKTKLRLYKDYLLESIGSHDDKCDDYNGEVDCGCRARIQKRTEEIKQIKKIDNLDYNILKDMIQQLEPFHYDSVLHDKTIDYAPVKCDCNSVRAKIVEIKLKQLKKDYNIK